MKPILGVIVGICLIIFGLLWIAFTFEGGLLSARDLFPINVEGRTFHNPKFSADGRWLAFDVCISESRCRSLIYDIPGDRYIAFRDAKGSFITNISFSSDGTQAVFVVQTDATVPGNGESNNYIAVGDIKEGRYRFITSGPGIKRHPEFWKDGAVIYVGTEPGDTHRRKSKYLYIVESGKQPRKLVNKSFYAPSRARPHWDGEQILMSEFGFSKDRDNRPISDRGDEILSIRPSNGAISALNIEPSTDHHLSFSRPVPAFAARLIYTVALLRKESNLGRGYRYDVFSINGNVAQRVSHLAGYFVGMDATSDGALLAAVTADTSERTLRDYRLLLYDTRNHSQRELIPKDVTEQVVQLE